MTAVYVPVIAFLRPRSKRTHLADHVTAQQALCGYRAKNGWVEAAPYMFAPLTACKSCAVRSA